MKKIFVASLAALSIIASTPAFAFDDSWDMTANMDEFIADSNVGGTPRGIQMYGQEGANGDWVDLANSVKFIGDAHGIAENTADRNPGTQDFALGARVTVDIPNTSGWSGNIVQKGFFNDGEQIKMDVVASNGGTFRCRFDGTTSSGYIITSSKTGVGDGSDYKVVCFKNNGVYGIKVGDTTDTNGTGVGSISPDRDIWLGNRLGGDATDQFLGKNHCTAYAYGSISDSTPKQWVIDELNSSTC